MKSGCVNSWSKPWQGPSSRLPALAETLRDDFLSLSTMPNFDERRQGLMQYYLATQIARYFRPNFQNGALEKRAPLLMRQEVAARCAMQGGQQTIHPRPLSRVVNFYRITKTPTCVLTNMNTHCKR